jgi:sugar phosphate isomerase/epimerase
MKRRTFVHSLGAAATGALSLPRRLPAGDRLDRFGLELYSVRAAMRADPERTMAAVRAMGYTDVELLWAHDNFGRTPAQVRATLDHEGLRAPSAHIAPEILIKDWDRSLDSAKRLGHEYLIVPSLPDETRASLEAWRMWADRFNTAGAAARRAGLWLAFHNEPDHMKRIAHMVPYDLFVQRLDPSLVRLQLDVGNMLLGGADPMQYLARHRSRYWSFHLKDVVSDRSRDTELGTGTFDFKRFLAAVPALAGKPCYVEQEGPADELASARLNCAYLRQLEF